MTLPISVLLGDSSLESLQWRPGLIGTVPVSGRVEMTGAAHTYVWSENMLSYSLTAGLGVRPTARSWTLRPEIGWLHAAEDDGSFVQFRVGVEMPWLSSRGSKPGVFDE